MHRILQEKPGRAQNSKLEDSMPSEYRTEFRVEDSGLNFLPFRVQGFGRKDWVKG